MSDLKPQRLTRVDAEGLVSLINRNFENIVNQGIKAKQMLVRFIDGEGWKTLNYSSIGECVKDRFPWSERTFWREFEAIEVNRRLGLPDDSASLPVAAVSALRSLPDDKIREAWDAATAGREGVTPTAAQVREAIKAVTAPPDPDDVPEIPGATTEVTVVGREPGDDDEAGAGGEFYAEVEPPSSAEDVEREFVASLPLYDPKQPLYGKLPPFLEKRYVADALSWKRVELSRLAHLANLRTQATAAKKSCAGVIPQYIQGQIFGLKKRGPYEWKLCTDCDGKGRRIVADRSTICSSCQNNGYRT